MLLLLTPDLRYRQNLLLECSAWCTTKSLSGVKKPGQHCDNLTTFIPPLTSQHIGKLSMS